MEEGKLEAILSGLGQAGKKTNEHTNGSEANNGIGKKSERDEDKKQGPDESIAKNVVQYIEMKEAGHFRYGIAFLVAQVK